MSLLQGPIPPRNCVWILHPEHPNEAVGLGRSGPHWRSQKQKLVPNVKGIEWEFGMQQVTVEHIYPQYASTKVLFADRQREGIETLSDALNGEFAEDSTILWRSTYLRNVEVSKVK